MNKTAGFILILLLIWVAYGFTAIWSTTQVNYNYTNNLTVENADCQRQGNYTWTCDPKVNIFGYNFTPIYLDKKIEVRNPNSIP